MSSYRKTTIRTWVANGKMLWVMSALLSKQRGPRDGEPLDCGDCAQSRVCWENPAASGCGVVADRRVVLHHEDAAFLQGGRFRGVYIVVSGHIKLRESRADGIERIVALRGPGDLIGLEGWARGDYPHAAIAAGGARLCRLSLSRSGAPASGALLERLLRKASTQLERTARHWAGLSAVERVAGFMSDLEEYDLMPKAAGGSTRLPMTRAEIGSYLGLAEETVVRALAQLRARKVADVDS